MSEIFQDWVVIAVQQCFQECTTQASCRWWIQANCMPDTSDRSQTTLQLLWHKVKRGEKTFNTVQNGKCAWRLRIWSKSGDPDNAPNLAIQVMRLETTGSVPESHRHRASLCTSRLACCWTYGPVRGIPCVACTASADVCSGFHFLRACERIPASCERQIQRVWRYTPRDLLHENIQLPFFWRCVKAQSSETR